MVTKAVCVKRNDLEFIEEVTKLEDYYDEICVGYDFYLASELIDKYYKENDKTLTNIVKNIEAEYNSLIQPDRLVLSLKSENIK